MLASSSDDQTIRMWDVGTGECLRSLEGHTGAVLSIAFNPEGDRLVSGSADQTLKLWDVATGECLQTLQGHSQSIKTVAISRDGKDDCEWR